MMLPEEQIIYAENLRKAQKAINDTDLSVLMIDRKFDEVLKRLSDCALALRAMAVPVGAAAIRNSTSYKENYEVGKDAESL